MARPHDPRRLNATQPAADGVDLRTLMNRMGHKKAGLAHEVYSDLIRLRIGLQQAPMGRTFSMRCRIWSALSLSALKEHRGK